jgi:rubredoxin
MPSRPRTSIRHCPVCGIAMQATKSRENLSDFDTFSCLSCDTTIIEAKPQPRDGAPGKG